MSAITSKISLFPRIPGYNVGDFTYWKNHIIHGFHVAILFSAALLHSIFYKRLRKTSILISLLAITDLLFFIKARAALICLIVIICYFMITVSKNNKKIILLSAIFAVLISSIYFTSPSVQQRVKSSVNELSSFNSKNDISTSGGTRLHYWQISWDMFLKAPLTGMGGGSFKQTLIMTNDPLPPQAHGHCHNEYISLLSQYGIVGISLFIYLLCLFMYWLFLGRLIVI
jgi:O-antigen ligase